MLKPDLEYLLYPHVSGSTFFYDKKQEIKKYEESHKAITWTKTEHPSTFPNN